MGFFRLWVNYTALIIQVAQRVNLSRLGLIQIPFIESYTFKDNYNIVRENPLFKHADTECKNNLIEGESISYSENYIKINELSKLFYEVCVKNS